MDAQPERDDGTDTVRLLLLTNRRETAGHWCEKLRRCGERIAFARVRSVPAAMEHVEGKATDVVLVDLATGDGATLRAVQLLRERHPEVSVIAASADGSTSFVIEAGKLGALEWVAREDATPAELRRAVAHAAAYADAQRSAQQARQNLHDLIQNSADGIVVVDEEGRILLANPSAEELFGRSAEQLQGTQFGWPVVPDERTEIHVLRPGGETAVAEMRVVPTNWRGRSALMATLRDVTETVRLREKLREMSLRDPLTGLYNRRGFIALAQKHLQVCKRHGRPITVVYADLDDMKSINDRFGHSAGDAALRTAGRALLRTFRDSDIAARIGGDEFAVLAVEADPAAGEQLLERLRDCLARQQRQSDRPFAVSLSAGLVRTDAEEVESIESLLDLADGQMYEVKRDRSVT